MMLRTLIAMGILVFILPASFAAEPDLDEVVKEAELALQEIMSDPEAAIPQEVLADAHGLIIWPKVTDIRLIAGAHFTTGVLLMRTADRSWDKPKFVQQKQGSVGLQAGYVRGSEIQVYLTRKKLDDFLKKGANSLVVGVGGRINESLHQSAVDKINANPDRVVQHYCRGSGMSGGVTLQVGRKRIDSHLEAVYYAGPNAMPDSAANLLTRLRGYSALPAKDLVVAEGKQEVVRATALMPANTTRD
jgi:lipid-binding SYLF domain-containing protein